jgi:tRNA splicing endonuclease
MMSTDEFKIRNLRGAICEYLDEGNIHDLFHDLRQILDEEEDSFLKKALVYKDVRKKLFK